MFVSEISLLSTTILSIAIFIIHVVLYVFALIKKEKQSWKDLLITHIVSFSVLLVYVIVLFSLLVKVSDSFWLLLVEVWDVYVCFSLILLSSIISFITWLVVRKKTVKTDYKSKLIITIPLIIVFCLLSMSFGYQSLLSEKARREEFSESVLWYVNRKYGDNNYKIVDIYNWNDCIWACLTHNPGGNTYEFTLKSDKLNDEFIVMIDIGTKEVIGDTFIEHYGIESNWCDAEYDDVKYIESAFWDCLHEKKSALENSYIVNKDDYVVEFDYDFVEDEHMNEVPDFDTVSNFMKMKFKRFVINKQFDNVESTEFKTFIIDLYNHYVKYYKKYNQDNKIYFDFGSSYNHNNYILEETYNLIVYVGKTEIIISKDEL